MAPLSRPLVQVARARLEDALGADLGTAHVWGLELTADLRLSCPVGGYLPLLLRRPRLQRVEYGGESVAFAVQARRLTFYDKVVECRRRKKSVPSGNVLRLELQFRKRLARQLGADGPFTFADLHDPDWWPRLVARWSHEYERVEKARVPLRFDTLGNVRRALPLVGLGIVGLSTAEAAVQAEMETGRIARSTGHDRLRWVRELAADPALTAVDERVAELDVAVRAAAEYALQCC